MRPQRSRGPLRSDSAALPVWSCIDGRPLNGSGDSLSAVDQTRDVFYQPAASACPEEQEAAKAAFFRLGAAIGALSQQGDITISLADLLGFQTQFAPKRPNKAPNMPMGPRWPDTSTSPSPARNGFAGIALRQGRGDYKN